MRAKIYFFGPHRGSGKALSLVLSAMLAFTLAGCATTDDASITAISMKLNTCEQNLVDIKEALCEGVFDGKPKTDPHKVIGLAKPKTDPHKACFSSWSKVSAIGGLVCDCEAQRASLMDLIQNCYDAANGNPEVYSQCLDKVRNYFGAGCPVSINRD